MRSAFAQCTWSLTEDSCRCCGLQLPLASKGKSFSVLAGSGSYFFPALTVGADGGVMALANIIPHVR